MLVLFSQGRETSQKTREGYPEFGSFAITYYQDQAIDQFVTG